MPEPIEPHHVIDRLIDAINSHDVKTAMSYIADDVEIYSFPSTLLTTGAATVRDQLAAYIEMPNFQARRFSTLVFGQTVVVLLHLTRTFPEGRGTVAFGLTYEVSDDKVVKVWIMAGVEIDSESRLPKFNLQST